MYPLRSAAESNKVAGYQIAMLKSKERAAEESVWGVTTRGVGTVGSSTAHHEAVALATSIITVMLP